MPVFAWVVANVVDMSVEIGLVAHAMFPITSSPESVLGLLMVDTRRLSVACANGFALTASHFLQSPKK